MQVDNNKAQQGNRASLRQDIYCRLCRPDDYRIDTDDPEYNKIVVNTDSGKVVMAIKRDVSILVAMELVKKEWARVNGMVGESLETIKTFSGSLSLPPRNIKFFDFTFPVDGDPEKLNQGLKKLMDDIRNSYEP